MADVVKFKLSPEAGGGVASLVGPPGWSTPRLRGSAPSRSKIG
jgi:hypothetical protein